MGEKEYIAAIDFGTTGVRAIISDVNGNTVGSGECEVEIYQAEDGSAEQSFESFWQAMLIAWENASQSAHIQTRHLLGLSFSQQRCTFALADSDGHPLTNFYVWMDRRGIGCLQDVHDRIGLTDYYEITGLPIYYISSLSKILWVKKQLPVVYHSAKKILPIAGFIMARMGVKNPSIDFATASFYGLMDTRRLIWSQDILDHLDINAALLPELVSPSTMVGKLTNQDVAESMHLPLGLPLIIGGGDQQCAALGSGMIELGHSLINLGSATALMAAVNEPVRDPNHVIPCVCHAAPGYWEMEGHTQASGILLQKFRDEFAPEELLVAHRTQTDVYDYLIAQAKLSQPGAKGLIFLPMLNGSTAPLNNPYVSGAMLALRLSHNRSDVIRAVLEGICMENRWILEAMQTSGAVIRDIHITGGASKSAFWNQLHADILKRPVHKIKTSNAALVGALICAGLRLGVFSSLDEGVERFGKVEKSYLPDDGNAPLYDEVFSKFIKAYQILSSANFSM